MNRGFYSSLLVLLMLSLSACNLAPQSTSNTAMVKKFAAALENGEVAVPNTTPPTTPWTSYANSFGFNAPWMFGVTHGPATTFSEMSEAAKLLNLPIIRFPGGTVSRTYHMNLPGYDGQQAGETENYIIPFTKIFAPVGSAPLAKISFLPNLDDHFRHITYHGSDEDLIGENLQTLTYLLDHGFKVELVELGNEEYLTPELFWSFGSDPWKPIETIDQNVQALTQIKLTYAAPTQSNIDYQRAHFKEGIDKYIALMNTYKTRINAVMDARGLARPKYGISIPWVSSTIYSDIAIFNKYYMERIRDLRGTDALIPHYYATYSSGNSAQIDVDLRKIMGDLKNYFGANDPRRFWITEFSANEVDANNNPNDDTPEQLSAFSLIAQVFSDPNYKTDYFFMHQYFKDGSDYGMLYKAVRASSKPVNGLLVSGVITPNPIYGKSLFYSPRFCWSVQARGATIQQYNAAKDNYGCK